VSVNGSRDFIKYREKLNHNDPINKKLDEIIQEMRNDINNGDLIKHKPYPKKYAKHEIKNLFVYDLPGANRLIYTRMGLESGKTCVFLEVLTHKEYDVIFGYHTS
jgi:hypothetical protein